MSGFAGVSGHEGVKKLLRKAVASGRASHSYIFEGPAGVGKKTLANAFAKALQCLGHVNGDSCGTCLSCRIFDSSNHPDCIFPVPSGKKTLGVDDVREQIIKKTETAPYRYRYKIFVVNQAEIMTPAAQNALLATIEEPSPHGIFIFCSSNAGAILPTVLSRCVRIQLKPLSLSETREGLVKKGVSRKDAEFLGAYSGGNIGVALNLAESAEFKEMRREITDMARRLRGMELDQVFSCYGILDKYRDAVQEALNVLLLWYRDLSVVSGAGDASLAMQADMLTEISEASGAGPECFNAVLEAREALRHNANFQLTMEIMLCKLNGAIQ